MRFIVLALAACLTMPAAAQEAALVAEGERLFMDFCAACHGTGAQGDGPMQEVLAVDVPDLTALAPDGSFPHFEIIAKIDGRDPLVSHGSAMPVWGDVFEGVEAAFVRTEAGQPIVTSLPIAALVAWLESVQG
ncbi:c-type cytochrome [Jannaschia aquimarina]|uniref:Cytochrome c n=1 Tax=Jannaschia aquimarina TaxID=935700 RepID=A0A0D1EHT1_9RHOB|nr:cytochrome c [Jannaschia aquimarina]KIT17219.1 Cytochrome c [Jannaschia aquimarina]SNT18625.1 Cytochrome C oxidase, cbb3-type, subunit III [Jannaschia aquimarina]